MPKIAHIADIHVRGLSRHDEFKNVFKTFVQDCRSRSVDHIFIAGDSFHTKCSGISPEVIDLLADFFRSTAEVAETHIILGNHDGALSNLSRQDAITPIVKILDNPKIHIYKLSGEYELEPGFSLCNFSIFDKPGWSTVHPIDDTINIACYHGPVFGARSESDYEISSEMTVDFFKGYDFVLLGDIHEQQHLSYRETLNGSKPWISYPGSAVQQNYGESLKHGYLLWDINSKDDYDVQFIELPNPKPYVTVDWKGNLDIFDEQIRDYPYGSRFRVRSDLELTQKEIYGITQRLQTTHEPTEVTFKIDHQSLNKDVIDSGTMSLAKSDLRNSTVLLQLTKEFYKNTHRTLSDEEWNSLHVLIKDYLESISSTETMARNTKWALKGVEFDNLYSYGEGNKINFEGLEGITGIFGPNRCGKSSIVGALMYTIFNCSDRGSIKMIDIVNKRKMYGWGKVTISVNGTDYVIERQTIKNENKRGITAGTNLNLFKIDETGSLVDMCGDARTDTDRVIRKLIGTSDDFMLTSLSVQGGTNSFIEEGATQRKMILARFLDLDIFESIHNLVKRDVNDTKVLLRNVPSRDWVSEIDLRNGKTVVLERKLVEFDQDLESKRAELTDLQLQLSKLSEDRSSVVSEIQVRNQKSKVESLEDQIKRASDELEVMSKSIDEKKKKIVQIKDLLSNNDITDMRKKLEAWRKLESVIQTLTHKHEIEVENLKRCQKSIDLLNSTPCGGSYPTCKFIKESYKDKERMEENQEKVAQALEKLEKAKESLDSLKDERLPDRIEKMEKIKSMESDLGVEVSRLEVDLHKRQMALSMYSASLIKERDLLDTYEESYKNQENSMIIELRKDINSLSSEIKRVEGLKTSSATQLGVLKSETENLIQASKKHSELQAKLRNYEILATAFSKKGIPETIITGQLPIINSEISKILHGIVDFNIELEVDQESNDIPIYLNYGDSKRIVELGSGMEKMISSIAIRAALLNVTSLPRSDVFIIDEGFGVLDDSNVESCSRLFMSLKKSFKNILVISHVDVIKDTVDNMLEITKNEKDSYVNHV